MFELLKSKEQKDRLEGLMFRCEMAETIMNDYLTWLFAYRHAISILTERGIITKEQSDLLFEEANKYYADNSKH